MGIVCAAAHSEEDRPASIRLLESGYVARVGPGSDHTIRRSSGVAGRDRNDAHHDTRKRRLLRRALSVL